MDLQQAGGRRGIANNDNFLGVDPRGEQSNEAGFAQLSDQGVRFDGVAICSGYTKEHAWIGALDTQQFDDVLSGNMRGPVPAMRAVFPLLTAEASVVALTAGIAQIGAAGYAAYGAAKAALNAIIRIFAAEVAPVIRVNGVASGAEDTAFIRSGFADGAGETDVPHGFNADDYNRLVQVGGWVSVKM